MFRLRPEIFFISDVGTKREVSRYFIILEVVDIGCHLLSKRVSGEEVLTKRVTSINLLMSKEKKKQESRRQQVSISSYDQRWCNNKKTLNVHMLNGFNRKLMRKGSDSKCTFSRGHKRIIDKIWGKASFPSFWRMVIVSHEGRIKFALKDYFGFEMLSSRQRRQL